MNDEVKAAAERRRAYLAACSNSGWQTNANPYFGNSYLIDQDNIALADAYLALHDPGAVTEEWLRAIGFETFGGCLRVRGECGWLDVTLPRGAMTAALWEWRHEPLPQITTRGQLRALLAAMGVNAKEGA